LAHAIYLGTDNEETDPEKTLGKPGNYWSLSATGYSDSQITIESNKDGNVVASVPFNGQTIKVEGKITENGIYDYVYSNGDKSKPFHYWLSLMPKWATNGNTKWATRLLSEKLFTKVQRTILFMDSL
jgi:hypothetical protein